SGRSCHHLLTVQEPRRGAVQEHLERRRALLHDDAVAGGLQLGGAGDAGHTRDVTGGGAHHPLDERRREPLASPAGLGRGGRGAHHDPLPPGDGGGVGAPVGSLRTAIDSGVPCPFPFVFLARFRCRLASQFARSSPSFGFDVAGVGSSGSTTCESGGRNPSEARLPGVPVSEARGVGSRCSTWSASVGPCPPARRLSGCCEPPLTASCAVGVFSRNSSSRPSFPSRIGRAHV